MFSAFLGNRQKQAGKRSHADIQRHYYTERFADPSGSRRFIGVELTAPIDVTTRINYDQLYAQAMDAISKGERYWFDQQETAELIAHNRKYQLLSPTEQQ